MEDVDYAHTLDANAATAAINTEYCSFGTRQGISVCVLQSGRDCFRSGCDCDGPPRSRTVAALSPTQLSRLAVSSTDQTAIYDIRDNARSHTIPGTGRAVTAIAWSYHEPDTLATGTVDGSTQIWTLKDTRRPLRRIAYSGAPCIAIAWSPLNQDILAVSGGGTVAIWSMQKRPKLVKTLVGHHHVTSLVWHPCHGGRLLTAATDATVRVWDVTGILPSVRPALSAAEDDSDDDDFFGELDGLQKLAHPITLIQLPKSPTIAGWIGEYGTFVLSGDGTEASVHSYGSEFELPHEVWQLKLEHSAETAVVRASGGATVLTVASRAKIASHRIPSAVLDSVGGHAQLRASSNATAVHDFADPSNDGSDPSLAKTRMGDTSARMIPIGIAQLRAEKGSSAKTLEQISQRRRTDSQESEQTAITALADFVQSPVTSLPHAMTTSLELPKPQGKENDALMPFLSPSIPARRPSPNTLPPIEDSLHLPPLESTSFESLPTTASHDSDSDDETFADGMQHSGTFLPGGINVPLPKACGALFAATGHLLAFFPPKLRPQNARDLNSHCVETEQRSKAYRVARLFPAFGQTTEGNAFDGDAESDSFASSGNGPENGLPPSDMQPAPFQSQYSWDAKTSPTKPTFGQTVDLPKVVVSAYEVGNILPSRLSAAEGYGLLRDEGESGSDVCLHNAAVAERIGNCDAASVWRLIAKLLQERVPLQAQKGNDEDKDMLLAASRLTALLQAENVMDGSDTGEECLNLGHVQWGQNPLARGWLVKQAFNWAERQADVQMLACMSAILLEANDIAINGPTTAELSMMAKLPTCGHQYATYAAKSPASQPKTQPVLDPRTESSIVAFMSASPTKLRHPSQGSLRNTSNSTTPYLDSSSSTPSFQFPTLSHEGSKLSLSGSGSASPEQHRSSFSSAAKHYAQSITDKFATSYGTSPPARKLGTSSGSSEPLSSLPAASGSWSKSVSFARSVSTANHSQQSHNYPDVDDDSDRTIDDNSLPHTPKGEAALVSLRLPNEGANTFPDRMSGSCRLPLLPQDLAVKAVVWRQHYAEQLRCWGLYLQATEMEKVSGLAQQINVKVPHLGVMPTRIPGRRKETCSICYSAITNIEQLCPACLHTTHLACIESYANSLDGEAYECPAGCGCACDALPMDSVDVSLGMIDEADAAVELPADVEKN